MEYKRKIGVKHQADVLVVGGGPSGVAAALAASRLGGAVVWGWIPPPGTIFMVH